MAPWSYLSRFSLLAGPRPACAFNIGAISGPDWRSNVAGRFYDIGTTLGQHRNATRVLWPLFFLILNYIPSLIVLSVIGHTKTLAHHTCEGQGRKWQRPKATMSVKGVGRDVHGSDRIGSDRIGLWSDRIKTIGYPRIRRSDPKFRIVF